MLEVRDLSVSYGEHRALEGVSVKVAPGEVVVILGANGAGKSTLLRTIAGICEGRQSGAVEMDGHPVLGLSSDRIVERGVALVPEGRGIFGDLTVRENLLLGAYSARAREEETANLDRVLSLFPKLNERQGQVARTMSGGEQQMVAIGRAMMSNPSILMLDEPSLGLSPLLCKELFQSLTVIRQAGIGILLVEQNAKQSLAIADRGYLLENAHIVHEDTAANLSRDPAVQKAYLGAGGAKVSVKSAEPPTPATAEPNIPETPHLQLRAPQRESADALVGTPISDLVAGAAKRAAAPKDQTGVMPTREVSNGSDRLRATILEIERAAAEARRRPLRRRSERHKAPTEKPNPQSPDPQDKPAVVEVYRAPRVEVYRRRPGTGKFTRE
ncbi:ABC transporter ATP-binding protein [Nitratireductor sp. XY-223]|uniref:ATP-binding cassette domain-containing protein n=1 Tax=Nitratireductor sp. XY-223 TaxID=2561926 RepID=UPI0010A9E888